MLCMGHACLFELSVTLSCECEFFFSSEFNGSKLLWWWPVRRAKNVFYFPQVSAVPHPYGNHVLFERSMRNPVGKQWNTGTTVNQLTKPRVSTLIGTVIEPIKATKEIKRSKPEDRKKKNNGEMSAGITIHSWGPLIISKACNWNEFLRPILPAAWQAVRVL